MKGKKKPVSRAYCYTRISMTKTEILRHLDQQIERLQQARRILGTTEVGQVRADVASKVRRGPRRMSADARARIAAAQKKRWAKVKSAVENSAPTPIDVKTGVQKRRLSAAARARIAAAQRKRWAKQRKAA